MKLVYLAQIGVLDNWAHTVQIMKMCEAFSQNDCVVTLVVPNRKSTIKGDPFEIYGIKKVFNIVKVPYIDLFQGTTSKFAYWVRSVSFFVSSRIYLLFHSYDLLYTREAQFSFFYSKAFIELHSIPNKIKIFHKYSYKKSKGIIVLTNFIKTKLIDIGISKENILVSHDAVKLEDFSNIREITDARKELNLNENDFLIGYVGTLRTLGMEKGVSTIIDSLEFLSEKFKLYLVGGEYSEIEYYKDYARSKGVYDRVLFVGKVPHKDVPLHLSVCNVLSAPFPANDHYSFYMSPLKIFEYMASKRPIIVTNLPSLNEVLTDKETALFISPGNSKELANAVEILSQDNYLSQKLSENAYDKVVNEYTWKIRAGKILGFIKK